MLIQDPSHPLSTSALIVLSILVSKVFVITEISSFCLLVPQVKTWGFLRLSKASIACSSGKSLMSSMVLSLTSQWQLECVHV